jgi:hypothetical protein
MPSDGVDFHVYSQTLQERRPNAGRFYPRCRYNPAMSL